MRPIFGFLFCLLASACLAQQKPTVSMWVTKNIAPSTKVRVTINTRNLPVVHVSAYRVDGEKWLSRFEDKLSLQPAAMSSIPVKQWDVKVASKDQRPNPNQADTYYSRQINLPPMAPGVYKLVASMKGATAWSVVNVTNLAIVVKRSPRHMLVWVTDALLGRIMPGSKVDLYDRKGAVKKTLTTGQDGAVFASLDPGEERVVVSRGRDMAGLPSAAENPDGQLRAHFQTDRPIYRPGQTIYYKAILRRTLGQVYRVDAGTDWKVELRDSKDNLLEQQRVRTNEFGSVNGSFEIPSEGATGAYSLVISRANNKFEGEDTAYQTITVAEYRKPEYKVETKPVQRRYMAGDTIEFAVDASYYFGAPVPQAAVHYTVRRSRLYFSVRDPNDEYFYGGDGNLYARDTYDENPFVAQETVYTDNEGHAIIRVPADKSAPDSTYSLSVTVEDSSRRQVQGGASVAAYSSAVRVSISPELSYSTLGSLIPLQIRTVDLDGKPIAAKVAIKMSHQQWSEKENKYFTVVDETTTVQVSPNGKARLTLPARKEGSFEIDARTKDSAGRVSVSRTTVYVYGNYEPPKKEKPQPRAEVKLDRKVYRPGDTAKALVTTNMKDWPILVVVEGGEIWDYKVITNPKFSQVYPVKAVTTYSPNAYVSIAQWVKGQLLANSVSMPIPDPAKELKITVTSDKNEYRPGDRATYTVKAKDATGKPVKAEVAVAVVDEAIYALSPDVTTNIYGFYWGLRENHVQTSSSAPEEMSGGAYQRVDTVAPLRQRFEDTAFWNATVKTDESGTATFSYEVPGNLTSWRATARGATMDTSVGVSTSNVLANRPVMLRLATPRQMVQGDRVVLIGTVDNRSTEDHQFVVSLKSEGLAMDGSSSLEISVPAKSQRTVEWQLDATKLPENGKGVLIGQVVAQDAGSQRADYSDALQVSVPIVPAGIRERVLLGGAMTGTAKAILSLPTDRIEPSSVVKISVSGGAGSEGRAAADRMANYPRYSTPDTANALWMASVIGLKNTDKPVKEAIAYLSRTEQSDGWGWWERSSAEPAITAKVLWSLANAKANGLTISDRMLDAARAGANARYDATNLWEHRALLAASLLRSGDKRGMERVEEVLRRGESMSPFARLRLADALARAGKTEVASSLLEGALKDLSDGPTEAYFPSGSGIGWSASSVEATAQGLVVLGLLDRDADLQVRLVRYLLNPDNAGWRSSDEETMIGYALTTYAAKHPDAQKVGSVTVRINGVDVETSRAKVGDIVLATLPRAALKTGDNVIELSRTEAGETFYTVDAAIYRPEFTETSKGVRVLRRFEVQNGAGIWTELDRTVKAGEPVRCTVVCWGDSIPDAVCIVEPIPAGFEFTESQSGVWGREEVRDGAVIHYIENSGEPQTFVYFLRAESEGRLTVLPAQAEYLRRPSDRGHSNADHVTVKAVK